VVFGTDVKKFEFERSTENGGRTLFEYSFQVTPQDSHYKVKYDASSWVFVGYSGRFQIDVATAELVGLTLMTGEMPPVTQVCRTTTTLEFERVQIGDGRFLLPKRVGQRFVYPDAGETENTTTMANCREFRGESTLRFSPEETAAGAPVKRAAAPRSLPLGLRFAMALTTSIAADTAAAGDSFTGKLVDPARDYAGKAVAPKGSVVEGRLLRVQSFAKPPETVLVLRPEALWIRGVRVSIHAVRDWTYAVAQRRRQGKGLEIVLPLQSEENAGAFRFPGEHGVVAAGFRSDWRTVK
jgi:hypothetical protein